MKKIIFSVLAALVVVSAIVFLVLKKKTQEQQAAVEASAGNDIPWLHLTQLDGTQFVAHSLKGKVMLVLFQPTCDHCQREATQIKQNLEAFKEYQIYFVTDAELPQISQFAKDYALDSAANVHFTHTSTNEVFDTFGSIQVPSAFIFSEKGRFVKSFIGETPVEKIIQAL